VNIALKAGLFIICLFHVVSPAWAKSSNRVVEGIVISVTEGDCIIVSVNGMEVKARLHGIDAPETQKIDSIHGGVKRGQAFGDAAFRALAQKILHQKVKLDIILTDRDNQEVCIVWFNNRNINLEMVAEGWAWFDSRYAIRPYAADYPEAEKQARAKKLGLWIQGNPQPPWEFRKMLKRAETTHSARVAPQY
jgi:micrococcal nuclease